MEEEGRFVLLLVVAARFPQERAHVGWLRRPQTKRQGTRPRRATAGLSAQMLLPSPKEFFLE